MWEYCIMISKNNDEAYKYICEKLNFYKKTYSAIITILEKANIYMIVVGCKSYDKNRLICFLQEVISECICFYYKQTYLKNNLHVTIKNPIYKQAFIYSLLFFDKETDKYIVNKYLNIYDRINIDGFFNFRLQTLKNKWDELIGIANENEMYLYRDETFTELIKFLIDNIEIKSDIVNIMQNENSYDIYDEKFILIDNKKQEPKDVKLVELLISLCPKNINIYCSDILPNNLKTLICKLFEKRVRFIRKINFIK